MRLGGGGGGGFQGQLQKQLPATGRAVGIQTGCWGLLGADWSGWQGGREESTASSSVRSACPLPRQSALQLHRRRIKNQTNTNQRQCTPQESIRASVFSTPNPVKPQHTHTHTHCV